MEDLTERNYLHPVTHIKNGQLKAKHFQTVEEGVMRDGTRIRRIESQSNGPVAHGYRFGIQVLPVNATAPAMHAFGSFDDINKIAIGLKDSPEKVFNTLRPLAPSQTGTFYLNDTPPVKIQNDMGVISENKLKAQTLYPNQGEEGRPYDKQQMEKRALKSHLQEVNPGLTEPVKNSIMGEE